MKEIQSTSYQKHAEIAQLVEHNLAKVGVASSSLVFRSNSAQTFSIMLGVFFCIPFRTRTRD